MKSASIVTALALLAIACTTTTTTTTPDPAAGKTATATDGGKADAAKTPADNTSGGPSEEPPAPSCADETGQQACAQCCAADNQAGAKVYSDAVSQCMCEDANCATECAETLCASTPANPDAACNTCFGEKQAACGEVVGTACGASADCMTFNKCLTDSGCATKK